MASILSLDDDMRRENFNSVALPNNFYLRRHYKLYYTNDILRIENEIIVKISKRNCDMNNNG